MKTGLIGTRWGRSHIHSLRCLGRQVDTIIGRDQAHTSEVARQEGIPRFGTNPEILRDMDLVIIASPISTHIEYISLFNNQWILCEKPLGVLAGTGYLPEMEKVFVNYAFGFLQTARNMEQILQEGSLGTIRNILLETGIHFPGGFTMGEWFYDVTVHPLSWILRHFPDLRPLAASSSEAPAYLNAVFTGETQLGISQYRLPGEGKSYQFTFISTEGVMRCEGGYAPPRGWQFGPVMVNGEARFPSEGPGPEDIWTRANIAYMGTLLEWIEGKINKTEALKRGLYPAAMARDWELSLKEIVNWKVRG